jgi:hypothetical protein
MTLLARCWKTAMRYGTRRRIEIILMATDAGRIGDAVVVVDVTISTLPRGDGVRSGQREA